MHELTKSPQQNISKEFLEVFNQLSQGSRKPDRIFNLTKEPSRDELRFIVNNHRLEIGLVRFGKNKSWKLITGTWKVSIPAEIADESDILAHTHTHVEGMAELPSPDDVFDRSSGIREFIVHINGVTYSNGIKKHPITGEEWKPKDLERDVYPFYWDFVRRQAYRLNHDTEDHRTYHQAYREDVLEKMGVVIVEKTWQELPDKNPLSQFLALEA